MNRKIVIRCLSFFSIRHIDELLWQVAHYSTHARSSRLIGHLFSLGYQVVIVRVWQWCPFEQNLIVFHHAYHDIIIRTRIEQVRRTHRQWPENIRSNSDSYIVRRHAVLRLVFDHLPHELDDEFERIAVLWWQLLQQCVKFIDATLWWNLGQVHVRVVLLKWANRILHLSHELFPVVGDNMAVLDRF